MTDTVLQPWPHHSAAHAGRRRARRGSVVLAMVAALGLMTTFFAAPATPATAFPYNGADISWPQCPIDSVTMPTSTSKFVIMGLTGGIGFTKNPCLADQVAWAKTHGKYRAAYAFFGYPSAAELIAHGARGPFPADTLLNRLRNVGYLEARITLNDMKAAPLWVPFVWIDIEPSARRPWSTTRSRNQAVVEGQILAYRRAGKKGVGFYLSPSSYDIILGKDYKLPEWHTVGDRGRPTAIDRCDGDSVQAGSIVLVQWWEPQSHRDLVCPEFRTHTDLTRYFAPK